MKGIMNPLFSKSRKVGNWSGLFKRLNKKKSILFFLKNIFFIPINPKDRNTAPLSTFLFRRNIHLNK
jgi:hypothetical protein